MSVASRPTNADQDPRSVAAGRSMRRRMMTPIYEARSELAGIAASVQPAIRRVSVQSSDRSPPFPSLPPLLILLISRQESQLAE